MKVGFRDLVTRCTYLVVNTFFCYYFSELPFISFKTHITKNNANSEKYFFLSRNVVFAIHVTSRNRTFNGSMWWIAISLICQISAKAAASTAFELPPSVSGPLFVNRTVSTNPH